MLFDEKPIPENFDFSKSVIKGILDDYIFEKVISSGSQAQLMKFVGKETGEEVVYKWYSRNGTEVSTQLNEKNTRPQQESLLEGDFMTLFSVVARVSSFMDEQSNKSNYLEVKNQDSFMTLAASYDNREIIKNHPSCVTPLVADFARSISDGIGGKKYDPACQPTAKGEEFELSTTGTHVLYTFEKGRTLDQLLLEGITEDKKETLVKELIRAGMIIHAFGIAHRDIKPQNILITDNYHIKILDLGIASRFIPSDRLVIDTEFMHEEPIMDSNGLGGSPYSKGSRLFSCKEVYSDTILSSNDIYSLGLICALILTGRHPFLELKGTSYTEYLKAGKEERKNISREYRRMIESSDNKLDKKLIQDAYDSFVKYNDNSILKSISSMFSPEYKKRPKRMIEAGKLINIKYPTLPSTFHSQEFGTDLWAIERTAKMLNGNFNERELLFFYQYDATFTNRKMSEKVAKLMGI